MSILSLFMGETELRRTASTYGGTYKGACPFCGGEDRFHVWPEQGRYWCRQCGKKGDEVQYLMERRGLSFPEACREAGREDKLNQTPRPPAPRPSTWTPKDSFFPGEKWQEQAGKLVEYSISKMNGETYAYLNGRGLADDTIKAARLGLWPEDRYVKRPTWGLPEKIEQGKRKDLWLPAGIVIPYFSGGKVARLRIRRNEGEPRYYVVSGSYMGPMILNKNREVFIIVESELDAFLLWQECGDLAGVVALGNAQSKPDTGAAAILRKAKLILVALDSDETGAKYSWTWWLKTFPQARRWPSICGKDPGEMWKSGISLREWTKAGIDQAEL